MSEVIFLAIAAAAGTLKIAAVMLAVVWAFRSLFSQHSAPIRYRYSSIELPFRSWPGSSK